jgi:Xaa-Pro aminopeptidase
LPIDLQKRTEQVLSRIEEAGIDALFVSFLPNVRYLTGFTGSNALLLLARDGSWLFTDPRYDIQAREETSCKVSVARGPLWRAALQMVRRKRWKQIGFESARLTYEAYQSIQKELPSAVSLRPTSAIVETIRMVKSEDEIALVRESVHTCSSAFERTVRKLKTGVSEIELAAELDYQMRRLGAERPSFDTIVASGPRSALPHASPTGNRIEPDQLLLVDMGASRRGYASDMTRMLYPGKPAAKVKRTYRAVLEAQLAAIDAVRDGVTAESVDRAARSVLKTEGLEEAFVHSTGHGLGLEIHEPPRLGRGEKTVLRAGMLVTIEPGVYLEGFGGIRIEDTVLVTSNGCEVLTPTSKELLLL